MTIQVRCQGCDRVLGVGPEHAGKRARCPVCGHITDIPADAYSGGYSPALAETQGPAPPRPSGAAGGDAWRMRTPEGQIYGPVGLPELDRWVAEGRVSAECQLQQGGGPWRSAHFVYPMLAPSPAPAAPLPKDVYEPEPIPVGGYGNPYQSPRAARRQTGSVGSLASHRGGLILGLAIASFLIPCGSLFLAVPAWSMASSDLEQMDAGRMDPSGRELTNIGKIIAIIHVLLLIASVVFGVAAAVLG